MDTITVPTDRFIRIVFILQKDFEVKDDNFDIENFEPVLCYWDALTLINRTFKKYKQGSCQLYQRLICNMNQNQWTTIPDERYFFCTLNYMFVTYLFLEVDFIYTLKDNISLARIYVC